MTHPLSSFSSFKTLLSVCVSTIIATLFTSGCAPRIYRPSQLPTEYAASPAVDMNTLDLSGLAGPTSDKGVICWGDVLSIEIDAGLPSLEARKSSVRVAKDGTAKIPLIGHVAVAGFEVEAAEAAIIDAARTRGVYPNPYVSVRIAGERKNRITVVGAVEKPGTCSLPRGASSLMAAIVASGGLNNTAKGDVEIRHTDPQLTVPSLAGANDAASDPNGTRLVSHEVAANQNDGVVRINLMDAAKGEGGKQELQNGDVVNIIPRELPPIHVLGLVNKPGSFDTTANRDMHLLDALALAEGCSSPVADKVTIRRQVPGEKEPVMIVASVRKAMDGQDNVLLSPGDTVMVRQTPQTVVVDIIKTFVRVSFGSSMALF
jgi:polysaccharide export outer membrane protein